MNVGLDIKSVLSLRASSQSEQRRGGASLRTVKISEWKEISQRRGGEFPCPTCSLLCNHRHHILRSERESVILGGGGQVYKTQTTETSGGSDSKKL
ncbi:hypothetical protein NQZ68_042197 [Dissostichus eleginoides]|nr:hypothetical protein NQZ68_042197 [Dissostichus eleginoides]